MTSANYKERFIAEYQQLKIRYENLSKMIEKHDEGKLEFTPTCPIEVLKAQKSIMGQYLLCLEKRAEIEGIDILNYKED